MRFALLPICCVLATATCFAAETNALSIAGPQELVRTALSGTLAEAHAGVSNALSVTDLVDDVMSNVTQAVDQAEDVLAAAQQAQAAALRQLQSISVPSPR